MNIRQFPGTSLPTAAHHRNGVPDRIKLLFFIDTGLSGGGAERVLCNLVNALDQDRFDITIATLWPENVGNLLSPHIHYQSLYPAKNTLFRNLYRLEAQLGTAVRRIKGAFDIEVAYLECGSTKLMSASKSRAKKVAWVHCDLSLMADDADAFVRRTTPWYEAFDHVVCVSESVRESFRKLYCDRFPCSVLYNVNDEAEILRKADAFTPEGSDVPTLCAVGRLSPEKDFLHLLRACSRLNQEDIPYRLQIIGEGQERPQLEEFIKREKLEDSVQLLGWQSNPYPYMRNADIIVCSSRYEGLSTVITEALILGKAVVTTPCGGMGELLGNSEHGLIAGADDDDLYNSLKKMLTEPGLMEHYAAAAAQRGRDFRRDALVGRHEAFFTELLEGTNKQ